MKIDKFQRIAFGAVPLIGAILAGLPDAVRVLDFQTEQVAICSYFTLVEGAAAGLCLPFSGYCASLAFGMALIFLVTGKSWSRKTVFALSFLSMTLGAIPVLVTGDVRLIPSMLPPILMGVECLLCRLLRGTKPQEKSTRLATR